MLTGSVVMSFSRDHRVPPHVGFWIKEKLLGSIDMQRVSDGSRVRIARATARPYKAAVTTLLVGSVLKFTGVPAEIFVDYEIHIRERVGDS